MGGNPNPPNQWKPGQSGNPKGRPKKGESITELMRKFLDEAPKKKEKTNKEKFVKKAFELAMEGDMTAMRLIWNYMDGKPEQPISGSDKSPIKVALVDEAKKRISKWEDEE